MRRLPVLLVCLAINGCSDAGLQSNDDIKDNTVDNKLVIKGEVCTSDPTSVKFPVKVLFIIDCSGSMQFTDPSDANTETTFDGSGSQDPTDPDYNMGSAQATCLGTCASSGSGNCADLCSNADAPGRQAAVKKVVDRFKNNPAVEFSIVRFNARVTVNGGACEGFTNKPDCINRGLESLTQAEIFTDYQGALTKAYEILERDMLDATAVERTRTKYVVIFVSDGAPDPQCLDGCGNDFYLGEPDSWCDSTREEWCDVYYQTGSKCDFMKTWYPSLNEPCRAYNSQSQIVQRVNEIMDLGAQYGVGELRMHTAFLFVPGLPKAILDLFDGTPNDPRPLEVRAKELLSAMATAGDGLYRNFTSGQQIDFLDINYASVSRPFGLTNIIVTNNSAWPNETHLSIDSDGDGVADIDEFEANMGMDDSNPDSDGDGYNDKLELDRKQAGFHPGDASIPPKICVDKEDLDGDGLRGCEEKVIGTDSKIADSDRDRVPDGVEFLWGTNPLQDDTKNDIDFDGKNTFDEISSHSNPIVSDPVIHSNFRYIYDIEEQPERPDRKKCYDFTVRNVRLVTTLGMQAAGTQGFNEILVYFGEGPADDPLDYGNFKAACVRAQYVEPNFKDPVDGKVYLRSTDFMDLRKLLTDKQDALLNPDLDPCVGAKIQ